jgi:hypothetical protein
MGKIYITLYIYFCRQISQKNFYSLVWVAHACNPSYIGGRDQKDGGLKPAQANSSLDSILKITNTKKDWWSDSRGRVPTWQV